MKKKTDKPTYTWTHTITPISKEYTLAGGYRAELTIKEYNSYLEWVHQQTWYKNIRRAIAVLDALRIDLRADVVDQTMVVNETMNGLMNLEQRAFAASEKWVQKCIAERERLMKEQEK